MEDDEMYEHLNRLHTKQLEKIAKKLGVATMAGSSHEDIVDSIWFSMDHGFRRSELENHLRRL